MSNALYFVGYLVVIIGVAYIAHLLKIPQAWIGGIVIVLIGAGLVSAAQMMKTKG